MQRVHVGRLGGEDFSIARFGLRQPAGLVVSKAARLNFRERGGARGRAREWAARSRAALLCGGSALLAIHGCEVGPKSPFGQEVAGRARQGALWYLRLNLAWCRRRDTEGGCRPCEIVLAPLRPPLPCCSRGRHLPPWRSRSRSRPASPVHPTACWPGGWRKPRAS